MSYQALARKWRPKTFAEVVGQEHVVAALVNGLDNQRVHHAFLFTGTRGVGKTTLARIFARALNCEKGVTSAPCGKCAACAGVDDGNFIDLIEVDAASRTKVDDTRELLDNVQYTPTQGRFKIYLIDEVHMLSTHSFNALLKTLEEPPEHVKFLLATTDPQKLPPTILSRCIQFNLKAMEIGRLGELLEKILTEESVAHDRAALLILARAANGSVRDALSLLDQGIAYGNGEVREAAMRAMLGMIEQGFTGKLLAQICDGESEAALETVAAMALRSVDFAAALDEILSALHNAALCQVNPKALEWKGADSGEAAELAARDAELLQLLYQIALLGKRDLALAPDPRSGFEMALLRMIAFRPVAESDAAAPGTAAGVSAGNLAKTAKTGAGRPAAAAEKSPRKNAGGNGAEEKVPQKSAGENGSAENPRGNDGNGANGATSGNAGKIITDIAELRDGARWGAFIAQSGLSGLELEMVMHMLPESVAENTVHLTLDAEHEHLLDRGRMAEIERRLAERCEFPLKLAVRVGKITAEQSEDGGTPAARNDRGRAARQQAAEEAFHHDPKVQELVNLFDAEVVGDSIRPPAAPESSNDKPAE
ncbi:MAG: DNA polymerase III subunit gamma/tau [Gammaproteobacteria bacterium]|nr:DNA polymerase III subunit gamma/tau [Gammaproteobacteria bacterium]